MLDVVMVSAQAVDFQTVHRRKYAISVRDPEKEMRKLLKFINEPWSDQVLDYFKTEQNVPEYTHKNVLNPPSTKSIGKWKNS